MDSPNVSVLRRARRGSRRMAERINEQGWHLVDVSKESLHFNAETTSAGGRALLARRDFSDAFYSNTGSHGTRNTKVNPADVYNACRVWIQGRGVSAGATSKIAMRNACSENLYDTCEGAYHRWRRPWKAFVRTVSITRCRPRRGYMLWREAVSLHGNGWHCS